MKTKDFFCALATTVLLAAGCAAEVQSVEGRRIESVHAMDGYVFYRNDPVIVQYPEQCVEDAAPPDSVIEADNRTLVLLCDGVTLFIKAYLPAGGLDIDALIEEIEAFKEGLVAEGVLVQPSDTVVVDLVEGYAARTRFDAARPNGNSGTAYLALATEEWGSFGSVVILAMHRNEDLAYWSETFEEILSSVRFDVGGTLWRELITPPEE